MEVTREIILKSKESKITKTILKKNIKGNQLITPNVKTYSLAVFDGNWLKGISIYWGGKAESTSTPLPIIGSRFVTEQ